MSSVQMTCHARRRRAAVLCAGALTVSAWSVTPTYADSGAFVNGGGAGVIPADSPSFPGDRVQVALTARILSDGRVVGQFNAVHHYASGGVFAHLKGTVDCLTVSGAVAIVTGVITQGHDDLGLDPVGHRISWRITDGNPDQFAVDVDFVSGHTIAPCTSDPILALPVQQGNFNVGS